MAEDKRDDKKIEAAARAACRYTWERDFRGKNLDAYVEIHWRDHLAGTRAAVSAYLAGDVVVPREPTPEMLFYMSSIALFDASRSKSGNERAAYDAMLASTPQRDRG